MVEMVGLGGGLIMLWRADLDVTLVNFVEVYIDVWIENWLPRAGCFLTRFYGHWNPKYKQHSWNLLKHVGDNRVLPCASLGISMSYYILTKPPASCGGNSNSRIL